VTFWALILIPLASIPALRHIFRSSIAQAVRQRVMD